MPSCLLSVLTFRDALKIPIVLADETENLGRDLPKSTVLWDGLIHRGKVPARICEPNTSVLVPADLHVTAPLVYIHRLAGERYRCPHEFLEWFPFIVHINNSLREKFVQKKINIVIVYSVNFLILRFK